MYAVILDIAVLIVLAITIRFCLKLNKKIDEMYRSKSDMIEIIKSLDTAVISTHKNLNALKEASVNANNEIKRCIEQGNELANDISFMIESGNRLVNKLEKVIDEAKQVEVLINSKVKEYNEVIGKVQNYDIKRKRRRSHKNKVTQE